MTAADHRAGRVALLIDADNLSADVIEQAIEHLLQNHGAIHFRRAYCSPQKAMELMELFRRHAIRPMVNVPTGKNSTDIALAVDAIDLALTERPDVVVIASSDSDYAPLAQRLREKGCRVLGIGQAGKTGSESPLAYDGFIDLAHRGSKARPETGRLGGESRSAAGSRAARPAAARQSVATRPPADAPALAAGRSPAAAMPLDPVMPPAAPVPPAVPPPPTGSAPVVPRAKAAPGAAPPASRSRAAATARSRAAGGSGGAPGRRSAAAGDAMARPPATPRPLPVASLPPEVLAILQAVPELRSGNLVDLNGIGAALRQHDILTSRNASPSRLLKRLTEHFELLPADKPRSVRFLGETSGSD